MQRDLIFYQEAIQALFSKLELNESMQEFFFFLRRYFPLEALCFQQFNRERQHLNIIFTVTERGFFFVNQALQLSDSMTEEVTALQQSRRILYATDSHGMSTIRRHSEVLGSYFDFIPRQYLVIILSVENEVIGHLACVGKSERCFNLDHERWLGLMADPVALAVKNLLKLKSIMEHSHFEEEKNKHEYGVDALADKWMVGIKSGLQQVAETLHHLEHSDSPVIILGETGTGKELVANAIQSASRRRKAPFIKLNCGAIPESLLDGELFGYEKGAFTGAATAMPGKFEQAHTGTLFLDEVGELSLHAQVSLLRVLEDGIVQRLGSTRCTHVDVRILTATNRDLSLMLEQGTFRSDLYHRLHVVPVFVPPLRDRWNDIALLTRYFADRMAQHMGIQPPLFLPKDVELLQQYTWPGNVRELENLVARAMIMESDKRLINLAKYLPDQPVQTSPKYSLEAFPSTPADTNPSLATIIDQRIALALNQPPTNHDYPDPLDSTHTSLFNPDVIYSPHFEAKPFAGAATTPTAKLDEVMRNHICAALRHCRGKVYGNNGAAELLGLHNSTLRSRMRKLNINPKNWAQY